MSLLQEGILTGLHGDKEVAADLEAEPARSHAGCNLQQVGHDPLEHAPDAFLLDDRTDSVGDRSVLVTHAGHGVDLKSSAQHIAKRRGFSSKSPKSSTLWISRM